MAVFRCAYVSFSSSPSDSNMAHARPMNSFGNRRSFLAWFHSFAAAHSSYCLNHDLASPSSKCSVKHTLSPVAIDLGFGTNVTCHSDQDKGTMKSLRITCTTGGGATIKINLTILHCCELCVISLATYMTVG